LDPFFGTGTTGAVAKKLKRNYIGIEKEAEYIALAERRISGIQNYFPEADWVEEAKKRRSRVPFEALIKEHFIKAGELLYSGKTYGTTALVLADGKLKYRNQVGSIHRIGAFIQQTPSCNGWKFWYILRDNESILIDELRNECIRTRHGIW
jgi:modification methylase